MLDNVSDGSTRVRTFLHLGAHKTASTHFNRMLRKNSHLTDQYDVAVPKKDDIRTLVTRQLAEGGELLRVRSSKKKALKTLLDGHKTLFLSDENILGTPNRLFQDGLMYPMAAKRLRRALKFVRGSEVELMLAVRAPTTFVTSSYGEAMRAYGFQEFDDYVGDTPLTAMRWGKLIRRLMRVAPELNVTVWTYENYRETLPRLMRMALGLPEDAELEYRDIENVVRPGLSQRAIDEIRKMCETLSDAPEQATMEEVVKAFPKSDEFPAPKPWSDEQASQLEKMYRKDLRQIAEMERVTFLG